MRQDAEKFADEDKRKKEDVEVRNEADASIYTAEKALRDLGDRVPADKKTEVEDKLEQLRTTVSGEDKRL